MNKEALEELSFGLDLLNLATHLSGDVSGDDADKVQNAVHVLRIVARGSKSEQPPR